MKMPAIQGWKRIGVAAVGLLSLVTATGCQVDVSGQTLPSPYWLFDDVQYFAPGTEFKLSREAAAMQEAANAETAGGAAPAPAAVLIRPDGYVAWAGDSDAAGLADALTRWFGPPAGASRKS